MTDDLVERVADIIRDGRYGDDAQTSRQIARAIIPLVLEHAAARAVKAYNAGEHEGATWDCFGSAEFAIAAAIRGAA